MDDRRLFRMKRQVQLKALIDRIEFEVTAAPLNLPIAVPDAAKGLTRRRDAWPRAIGAFRVIKLPAIEIAQREMCEVEILHIPGAGLCGIAADGLAEEGQFESEPVALGRFQISGVVPPLGLKVRMIEIVARRFVAVSWQGSVVLRRERLQEKQRGDDTREPTPHGRPQADSGAQRPAPGRVPRARLRHTQLSAHQEEFPPASETVWSSRTTAC